MADGTRTNDAGESLEERISLADVDQVQRCASRLGISPERLRELIAQVGPRFADLRARLNQPENLD